MFRHPLPAGRGIHRLKGGGKWFDIASPDQGQHMIPAQQRFKGTPDFGPKLDLSCDGSFHKAAGDPGVQQQGIRDFDWLTHGLKVAKRYHLSRLDPTGAGLG